LRPLQQALGEQAAPLFQHRHLFGVREGLGVRAVREEVLDALVARIPHGADRVGHLVHAVAVHVNELAWLRAGRAEEHLALEMLRDWHAGQRTMNTVMSGPRMLASASFPANEFGVLFTSRRRRETAAQIRDADHVGPRVESGGLPRAGCLGRAVVLDRLRTTCECGGTSAV
jgi:hypothetical protein